MNIFKFLVFLATFTSSCAIKPTATVKQQNNVAPKVEKNETESSNTSSSSGGSSSSSGGSGSSGGSSSNSSSSSNGSTPPSPTPVNPAPLSPSLTIDVNLKETSFRDVDINTKEFTTPLFKMEYDDSDIEDANKKGKDYKENLLETMYDQFLKNATYGNEVYTLDKVVFKQKKSFSVGVAGTYFPQNNSIEIEFFADANDKNALFSVFLHEYYHHLTVPKIDQAIGIWVDDDAEFRKDMDNYYYQKYMDIFNNGIKLIDQNVRNIDDLFEVQDSSGTKLENKDIKNYITRNSLRNQTFRKEIQLYKNNHFNNNSKLITWSGHPLVPVNGNGVVFEPGQYYLQSTEILARYTSMVTNTFWPKNTDGIPQITLLRRVIDYLQAMFIRTNIYYSYKTFQRLYPKVLTKSDVISSIPFIILDKHHLNWEQINVFENQNTEKMKEKWLEWKNYFKNIFFNTDQLLSGAITDKDDNLYLELNAKNKVITFEEVENKNILNAPVTKFNKVGQIVFNTKPYDEDNQEKEILNNNYLYKINKANLPKGVYYIKVNGAYQSEGFEIANLSNNVKMVWDTNKDNDAFPIYKLYKHTDGNVVLEVI